MADLYTLKVKQLRAELRKRGLSTSGLKAVLQQRLLDALDGDRFLPDGSDAESEEERDASSKSLRELLSDIGITNAREEFESTSTLDDEFKLMKVIVESTFIPFELTPLSILAIHVHSNRSVTSNWFCASTPIEAGTPWNSGKFRPHSKCYGICTNKNVSLHLQPVILQQDPHTMTRGVQTMDLYHRGNITPRPRRCQCLFTGLSAHDLGAANAERARTTLAKANCEWGPSARRPGLMVAGIGLTIGGYPIECRWESKGSHHPRASRVPCWP